VVKSRFPSPRPCTVPERVCKTGSRLGSPEGSGQVFNPTPHRAYKGHQADVLDVAWSRSYFVLTASMDKSVRLWHVSMDDCLRVFRWGTGAPPPPSPSSWWRYPKFLRIHLLGRGVPHKHPSVSPLDCN